MATFFDVIRLVGALLSGVLVISADGFALNERRERVGIWHNHLAVSVVGPNLFVSASSTRVGGVGVGGPLIRAGDIESTRIVYAMVIGLVLIGLLFALLGIWIIRQTRIDQEVLAPLERMGDRDWRKSDPASQRRSLDAIRPEGAEPLQTEPHRPRLDGEFYQSARPVQSFDDMEALGPEGQDATPIGTASLALDSDDSQTDQSDPESAEATESEVVGSDPGLDSVPDVEVGTESDDADDDDPDAESGDRTTQPAGQ